MAVTPAPRDPRGGFTSGALGANLARTAVDPVVPAGHLVLLEIADGWLGVHAATQELLREVHHRYVGWAEALADLHRRAMQNFHLHLEHPRGPEGVLVFCDLYDKIASEANAVAVRQDAVRLWLTYLTKVAGESGDALPAMAPVLRVALERLGARLAEAPGAAVLVSPRLHDLVSTLAADPLDAAPALDAALGVLAASLDTTYAQWAAGPDATDWYRDVLGPRAGDGPLPAAIEQIAPARYAALRDELRAARGGVGALLRLPDNAEIVRAHLDAADVFGEDGEQALLDRVHWLFRALAHPGLATAHEQTLRDVSRISLRLLDATGGAERTGVVRDVFALLRRERLPYPATVLSLTERLGRQVLAAGDPALTQVLIDEVVGSDFHYPAFSGYTPEWGVLVDPAHLRNVRAYLAMVEADPQAARGLLVALVVHLKLGGVFLADTDLFQKDISALLARRIRPVYLYVKQLLRLFPVYFSEIGAEGELRDTSTRLDQLRDRRDPLCHFLRKQCHVECNPALVDYAEEIARYWLTGDAAPLAAYVPGPVLERLDEAGDFDRLHAVLGRLAARAGGLDGLLALGSDEVRAHLDAVSAGDETDREKVELLLRVRREIRRKYALDHDDVVQRLRDFGHLPADLVGELEAALGGGSHREALELSLELLERLQALILAEGRTEAVESIYRKRHVAVGIPSLYGWYREPRFEAMGLTFRLESLATALFECVIEDAGLGELDHDRLRDVAGWLRLLVRAMRIDGYRAEGVLHCIAMLDEAVERGVHVDQYVNIFQLLSRNTEIAIRARLIDVYEEPAGRIVARMLDRGALPATPGETREETVLKLTEGFLRDLIAGSFGLQRLDQLVGRVVHALQEHQSAGDGPAASPAPAGAAYDLDLGIVRLADDDDGRHGIVTLGGKGFMLQRLKRYGFQVPPGFLLTTELLRLPAWVERDPVLHARVRERVRSEIGRLETITGARFGNPSKPLLLSVRGGAPLSMPGMLESFLNVGINERVAAGIAELRGRPWAAWDAYRRFVQFWGMSEGLDRTQFDELMRDAKARSGVPKKRLLPPERMRELALSYAALVRDHGIDILDDPLDQVLHCIELVRRSWETDSSQMYRGALQIAEEWGTAAIVQCMVFGNLDQRSGTGVVLTRHPRFESDVFQLHGDFIVQGQGDDVVSGLVQTYPISERQRQAEAQEAPFSLEAEFPEIYAGIERVGRTLVQVHGMNHQEIEFTFESDRAEDLYILQTRDTVVATSATVNAFERTPELEQAQIAVGIGVSGGALSGRAAHTAGDIAAARAAHPGEAVILLRRDTVPDDIPIFLQADGLLTAVGGATSHAAVAAKRLGKTCVVGCRPFEIDERSGLSRFGDRTVKAGDLISINGLDGSVYLGVHPVTSLRVQGRAQQ